MAKKISAGTRHELVVALGARYRAAGKPDKQRILDEFVAVTGYHRKHVIRMLNRSWLLALSLLTAKKSGLDRAIIAPG